MNKLSTTSKVQRIDTKIATTDFDGAIVMLDIEQGKYYNLNAVSSDIWQSTEHAITVTSLVDILCAKYECTPEVCTSDTITFLNQLYSYGLLKIID